MSCDTEFVTHPLSSDDREFVEKSMAQVPFDSRSNSRIQTVISQKHPNVAKYDSVSTSIDKDENYHLSVSTIGNAETEENADDKIISTIDKETRNNCKVKFLSFSFVRHLQRFQIIFKSEAEIYIPKDYFSCESDLRYI